MAYFSNGTEGDIFQENNCEMCSHWNEETGCPVWDAHLIFAYDECDSGSNAEKILNMLIPMKQPEDIFPDKCAMFNAKLTDEVRSDDLLNKKEDV